MKFKEIIYDKIYLNLYPLLEVEPVPKSIYDYSAYIEKLLVSECTSIELSKGAEERNEKACNKTKRYKTLDKNEYGKREVFNINTPKKGYKKLSDKYKNKISELDNYYNSIKTALNHLYEERLTEKDINIIKELTYKNRYNDKFQFVIVGIILAIFTLLILIKFFI